MIDAIPYLLRGWLQTLLISGTTIVISLVAGAMLGALAASRFTIMRWVLAIYVNIVRGVPVLIFLFLIYFSLPALGIQLPDLVSVIAALSIYGTALTLENVRGAILAVGPEQARAAASLGLRGWQRLVYVVAPQATAIASPLLLNTAVHLIKCSAFVSIVGVWELSFAAREVTERTLAPYSVMFVVLVLYYVTCFPLGHLSSKLEQRYSTGRKPANL